VAARESERPPDATFGPVGRFGSGRAESPWGRCSQSFRRNRRGRAHGTSERRTRATGLQGFRRSRSGNAPSLYAPEAIHVASGDNPFAREYKGIDEILGYYSKLAELTDDTFTVELESVSVEGDNKAVATHRSRAQRAGKTLDQDEFLTYTFSGGKISRIVESRSDPAAYDEFWS